MSSWGFFVFLWFENVLNQSWTVNVVEKNVCKEVLRNLVKESKNFWDFIPWFARVENILDVLLVFLSDWVELNEEFSPLIFVRNTADNKFIQRVAKWYVFQVWNVLKIFSMEGDFFQVGHVTFFFDERKGLDQVIDTTRGNFEGRDSDRANFRCDDLFKQFLAQILGQNDIIVENFIECKHHQSENVVQIGFFRMLFESADKFFMVWNHSRVIFLFYFLGDINS